MVLSGLSASLTLLSVSTHSEPLLKPVWTKLISGTTVFVASWLFLGGTKSIKNLFHAKAKKQEKELQKSNAKA